MKISKKEKFKIIKAIKIAEEYKTCRSQLSKIKELNNSK